MPKKIELVCLISGGGRTVSNFADSIEAGALDASISLVIADRECSGIERLRARGLEVELLPWRKGETTSASYAAEVWPRIEATGADLVCLCGFLRLLVIPPDWERRVLNIHPGLLPEFGGKGMYGSRVHRAVLDAGLQESGCTVHFADNIYDHGPIVVQMRVPVLEGDTPDILAARVFEKECEAYPEAIRLFGEGLEDGKVSTQ
jgi:phosphoribosylglycinamide formyltransferase-1